MFRQKPSPENTAPESATPPTESPESKARKAFEDALSEMGRITEEVSSFLATDTDKSDPEAIKKARAESEHLASLHQKAWENAKRLKQEWFDLMNKKQ